MSLGKTRVGMGTKHGDTWPLNCSSEASSPMAPISWPATTNCSEWLGHTQPLHLQPLGTLWSWSQPPPGSPVPGEQFLCPERKVHSLPAGELLSRGLQVSPSFLAPSGCPDHADICGTRSLSDLTHELLLIPQSPTPTSPPLGSLPSLPPCRRDSCCLAGAAGPSPHTVSIRVVLTGRATVTQRSLRAGCCAERSAFLPPESSWHLCRGGN